MARGVEVIVFDGEARRLAEELSFPDRVQIAGDISAEGAASAPTLTGSYASSFGVEAGSDPPASVNTDPAASYITFGTSDTPPHMGHVNAARRRGIYEADESQ
jgi:hypothetical protein